MVNISCLPLGLSRLCATFIQFRRNRYYLAVGWSKSSCSGTDYYFFRVSKCERCVDVRRLRRENGRRRGRGFVEWLNVVGRLVSRGGFVLWKWLDAVGRLVSRGGGCPYSRCPCVFRLRVPAVHVFVYGVDVFFLGSFFWCVTRGFGYPAVLQVHCVLGLRVRFSHVPCFSSWCHTVHHSGYAASTNNSRISIQKMTTARWTHILGSRNRSPSRCSPPGNSFQQPVEPIFHSSCSQIRALSPVTGL